MKLLKWIAYVTVWSMMLNGGIVLAEKMYVTDQLKLTVRTDPTTSSTVVAVLGSGSEVEVVAFNDEWSRVQLPDDREGWVMKRYLTNRETDGRKLKRLQSLHKTLTLQNADLLKENKALKKDAAQHKTDLDQTTQKIQELDGAYQSLKSESSNYLKLKATHAKTVKQLNDHTEKVATLKAKVDKLESRQTIRWFLTGAGVLVLGFVIGFSTRRQRRKSSLLH
jgi:SH3 domain protein